MLVGTVLQGSFKLTRLIGQGGMGTVYEGTQLRLNKRVAIKLLSRHLTANQEALARFRREAEVTSQLGHPHIVQVFDFGTAPSGEPYLVMEYLEGEDLDQRIRRVGRIRLAEVGSVIKQIASALSATHARGIVHRDLKPANVFLLDVEGENDFVKIVDFGISKVRAASVRITGESVVIGTPNYMSPEQATGQVDSVDHKTDQWSLACIAYEMLSGRGPFLGETIQSLLYQVVHQDPRSLKELVPGLPNEVASVIERALSKQSTDRFPTVNAFSRALLAASTGIAEVPIAAIMEDSGPGVSVASASLERASPRVTTLSRSASEMRPFSRLRMRLTPKSFGAAALTAVLVVTIGSSFIIRSRSIRPRASVPAPPAAAPGPPAPIGRPPVDIMPLAPPSLPTLAPPAQINARIVNPSPTLEPDAPPQASVKRRRVKAARPQAVPALSSPTIRATEEQSTPDASATEHTTQASPH